MDLTEEIQPTAGDRYFLVVPVDDAQEGTYGTDSSGNERPTGVMACRPTQNVVSDCP